MSTSKITTVAAITGPFEWVELKREYCANNRVAVERKSSRQHARWFQLRMMLRRRWQVFTVAERAECERLFGETIDPPGA